MIERKTLNINKIKGLMAENGLTQEQMAKELKITGTAFRNKLNSKTEFKISELLEMANIFNVEAIDIFFTK